MEQPKYMPQGEPSILTDKDVLEYKLVPGIGFHKPDDGILYYYDTPLMFVAYIEGRQVVVTLLDDDINYPETPRAGWNQWIAILTDDKLLHDINASRKPLRDYWDQNIENWFIHEDWIFKGETSGTRYWASEYKIWKNVPIEDSWKAEPNTYFNIEGKQGD